jgi:hypothetical protein
VVEPLLRDDLDLFATDANRRLGVLDAALAQLVHLVGPAINVFQSAPVQTDNDREAQNARQVANCLHVQPGVGIQRGERDSRQRAERSVHSSTSGLFATDFRVRCCTRS